jgi:hypothetical protein
MRKLLIIISVAIIIGVVGLVMVVRVYDPPRRDPERNPNLYREVFAAHQDDYVRNVDIFSELTDTALYVIYEFENVDGSVGFRNIKLKIILMAMMIIIMRRRILTLM